MLHDAPDQPATITGALQSVKNGTLSALAGRKKITAKLAEGAAIVIDSKDYRIAQRGNAVHFEGTLGDDKTSVSARKIEITVGSSSEKEERDEGKAKKKEKQS
jgi:hypothetical protein